MPHLKSHQALSNQARSLLASERFRNAKTELLAAIGEASTQIRQIRGPQGAPSDVEKVREQFRAEIAAFVSQRGRDLYFPFLSSGLGSGPFVELTDGSVKYDMITGIGINFFGHAHPELMSEMVDAVCADTMQGNLMPGHEAVDLLDALLSRVGQGSRLKHGWFACSGTMVNEIALKMIRQKRAPATRILAFKDCFAGRSTAMQEITDNPKYREGQPTYGEVSYLPFYDPAQGSASTEATLQVMRETLARYPGTFAALMLEIVQGEGGFNAAPKDFYVRVFEEAKKAGLAIWADEIQTFGRTGELFAYQTFDLAPYIDVVTTGKMLQACAVLFTPEYVAKPGLIAGTFSGSTVALRTGRKTLELLSDQGYLGPQGKIAKLSGRFKEKLEGIARSGGGISQVRNVGGMIAFMPGQGQSSGTMDEVKALLVRLFDAGVVAFFCGHGPYLIRMLPPLGAMTEADVDAVCEIIGRVAKGAGGPKVS